MCGRLMVLVSDIMTLGSEKWDDHKVTKKLLRAFTPRNPTLATMIRRGPKFMTKTPNQLLGEIRHQELVKRDVASLSHKMNTNVAFNVTPCLKVDTNQSQQRLNQVMKRWIWL